jgi:hypothetical protein
MRVAIMQPTYLPWCGYFGLMQSVDLFIFLDTVPFQRRSWQQRNRIKTSNGEQWLTIPVKSKGKRNQNIQDVEIDSSTNFFKKHAKAIEINYRQAEGFGRVFPALSLGLQSQEQMLANFTISLLMLLRQFLGIETPVIRSSELTGEGAKAELLASLCLQVGATEYVAPPGSREYMESSDVFQGTDISVSYFEFAHPQYTQLHGDFLPYMSCIDMIMNCREQPLSLIQGNVTMRRDSENS